MIGTFHSRARRSGTISVLRRAVAVVALVACIGASAAMAQSAGAIRGVVLDLDYRVPLPGVRVVVVGTQLSAVTTETGSFVIENVPPGTYTLALTLDGYERRVVPGVAVAPGRLADVETELGLEVVDMEEFVVTGDEFSADSEIGTLEIRMSAVAVQDSISSDLISKAGASDVAGALPLVVGASVVDGKYATVRGLSDRYTGTTLNGVRLPSADPRRRAVQVDLFPTGTVENVTVTKTFTPDLQGDFTGGGVDIQTKDVPDGPIFSIGASFEWDSIATGNDDFLTYNGAGLSAFSKDESRDLPTEAAGQFPQFPQFATNPRPQDIASSLAYDQITRAFEPTMGTSTGEPGANKSFSLLLGNAYDLGRFGALGVIGGLTYRNNYTFYDDGINNTGVVSDPGEPIALIAEREDSKGAEELNTGFLASVAWQPNEAHDLTMILVENFVAEDTARIQVQDVGGGTVEQNQTLQYVERRLGSAQLAGNHEFRDLFHSGTFNDLTVDWSGSFNFTEQDEPDVRFFRNRFDYNNMTGEMPPNSTNAKNTRRIWRDLTEDGVQFRANATVPFRQWGGIAGELKGGFFYDESKRDYEQNSFTYTFANQSGSVFDARVACNRSLARFRAEDPDQLWTDVFTDPGRIGLVQGLPPCEVPPGTQPAPAPNQLLWVITPLGDDVNYTGDQQIDALYAMADLPIDARFKAVFGARYESTDMLMVPTNALFGTLQVIQVLSSGDRAIVTVPQEEAIAEIEDGTLLPSIGFVYEARPSMFVRASWNRTLARPTFRELAPVATEEFIFGDEFVGNPDLVMSKIENFDVRWEWFRRPGEVLAVSGFHKNLDDPIELISFATGNRSFIQPVNFGSGTVSGLELEARTSLDILSPAGRNWAVGLNYTKIDSSVDVPESEQRSLESFGLDESTRRLQGQPAYLLNANVTWDNSRRGIAAALFYNFIGETLATGAARGNEDGTPNVFTDSFRTLDFTLQKQIGRGFALDFKARNLLTPDRGTFYETPEGEQVTKQQQETALRVSVGVKWTL